MCEKADKIFEEQQEELKKENLDNDEYLICVADMRENADIHSFDDIIRDFQIAVYKLNKKQVDSEDFTRLMVVRGKRPIHYILPGGFSKEEITMIGRNIFNYYSFLWLFFLKKMELFYNGYVKRPVVRNIDQMT